MDGEFYYIERPKERKYTEMVAGLILQNHKSKNRRTRTLSSSRWSTSTMVSAHEVMAFPDLAWSKLTNSSSREVWNIIYLSFPGRISMHLYSGVIFILFFLEICFFLTQNVSKTGNFPCFLTSISLQRSATRNSRKVPYWKLCLWCLKRPVRWASWTPSAFGSLTWRPRAGSGFQNGCSRRELVESPHFSLS